MRLCNTKGVKTNETTKANDSTVVHFHGLAKMHKKGTPKTNSRPTWNADMQSDKKSMGTIETFPHRASATVPGKASRNNHHHHQSISHHCSAVNNRTTPWVKYFCKNSEYANGTGIKSIKFEEEKNAIAPDTRKTV